MHRYEPSPANPVPVDLKTLVFDARLIYDTEEEKEVDFIKLQPLDTKMSVNEVFIVHLVAFFSESIYCIFGPTSHCCCVILLQGGTFVNCEARLKVLTSQLEDSFFKIRFRAFDARTKKYKVAYSTYKAFTFFIDCYFFSPPEETRASWCCRTQSRPSQSRTSCDAPAAPAEVAVPVAAAVPRRRK